ncbi:MAG: Dihydrolipoamide acetyltransferase component of pyruvate dehydrogenase complex, partial [uncultured Rubrobacteraceae bacterium]
GRTYHHAPTRRERHRGHHNALAQSRGRRGRAG